jgi:hypothetical protein
VTGCKNNSPQFTVTTNGATAAGGTVLSFASLPGNVVPGLFVTDDTNPGALNAAQFIIATTSTTVTLNSAVQSPGVSNGDAIRFWVSGAQITEGKNLRVTGTFASSNTLNFTFIRSITAQTALFLSTHRIIALTGRFYPTDVGKAIKIVGAAASGWNDTFGFITNYIDSTHVEYAAQPAQTNVPSFNGNTVNIGTNEPDANYVVAGLCGDANETFWVTGITTTGFTLHSSNASSTANVTALIVR